MKVHLIRSAGIQMEDFNNIFNILNQYSGGIAFVPSEPIELPDTDIEITMRMKMNMEDKKCRRVLRLILKSFFRRTELYILGRIYLVYVFNTGWTMKFLCEQVFLLTDKK